MTVAGRIDRTDGETASNQSDGRRRLRQGAAAGFYVTPAGRRERGSSSGVEHQPSKLRVAGSNPVSRSMASFPGPRGSVVEHFLGKEGVTGSIPVVGSTFRVRSGAQAPLGPAAARRRSR